MFDGAKCTLPGFLDIINHGFRADWPLLDSFLSGFLGGRNLMRGSDDGTAGVDVVASTCDMGVQFFGSDTQFCAQSGAF